MRRRSAADAARRERLASTLEGVEGWLDINEAWQLHESARRLAAAVADPGIVEIGSWMGRSAISLALGLGAAGSPAKVHAIDPHGPGLNGEESTLPGLIANLEAAGVRERVVVMQAMSHDARPSFASQSVDVLYVDGSHEYEDVLRDIDDWTSALRDGAVIAFNDVGWPGVNAALRLRIASGRSPFRRPWFAYNTIFFEFRPQDRWTARDTARRIRLRLFFAFTRRFAVLWKRTTRRLPSFGVALLGLFAWGAHRLLLRSSPYGDRRSMLRLARD